jgi:hypothetical protein
MQTFAGKTASAPAAAPTQVAQETAIEAEDTLDI